MICRPHCSTSCGATMRTMPPMTASQPNNVTITVQFQSQRLCRMTMKRERSMRSPRLSDVALERDEAAEPDQHDAGAGEEAGVAQNGAADERHVLRRDDAPDPGRGEDPADRGDDAAPVARPDIVDVEDGEAEAQDDDARSEER